MNGNSYSNTVVLRIIPKIGPHGTWKRGKWYFSFFLLVNLGSLPYEILTDNHHSILCLTIPQCQVWKQRM